MRYRLIASDYDGTLRLNGEVCARDANAVKRWQALGGLFGVVTGRGGSFPARIAPEGVACDFFICDNGALILDKNGALLCETCMDACVFEGLERAFRARGEALAYDVCQGRARYHQYSALMETADAARAFARELNAMFPGDVNALANGRNINVVKNGVGKAEGVRRALAIFGIDEDAACVVGDDLNDLDMIRAFRGWAMENGREEVRRAAKAECANIADLVRKLLKEDNEYGV